MLESREVIIMIKVENLINMTEIELMNYKKKFNLKIDKIASSTEYCFIGPLFKSIELMGKIFKDFSNVYARNSNEPKLRAIDSFTCQLYRIMNEIVDSLIIGNNIIPQAMNRSLYENFILFYKVIRKLLNSILSLENST